jgi:hypothetical protein
MVLIVSLEFLYLIQRMPIFSFFFKINVMDLKTCACFLVVPFFKTYLCGSIVKNHF